MTKPMPKQRTKYHPELISLFLENIPAGVIIGNTIVPLLFIFALKEYVPINLLISLFIYSLIISLFRVFSSLAYKRDKLTCEKYVKYTIFSMAFSGSIWGFSALLTYLYAPYQYLFFTTTLIMGLISASVTSLTPIFKSFIVYVLFGIMPLLSVFFLIDGVIYLAFSLLIIAYTVFIINGGYKHYKKLREVLLLKDKLKLLNDDLEGEVKIRTLELEELNNSLEDKIAKEIEKNRQKDQKMLQQSRMAQMGEMISMIAHQWRQPLGAISSTSIDLRMKMMLDSYDLNDSNQQKECISYMDEQLTTIEGYVQSLTQTIDDFRNFYKPDKKEKTISVNIPIQKSLDIIKATATANGIEIVESYNSTNILPIFDSELMQVFLNILKNAQDNFKEKDIKSAKINIVTTDIEDGVKVEICDNGGGIDNSIMDRIFDPYFSTKSEKNGTGLGLYMSKTIVCEHHNGKLSVQNRDNGVCFTIEIRK